MFFPILHPEYFPLTILTPLVSFYEQSSQICICRTIPQHSSATHKVDDYDLIEFWLCFLTTQPHFINLHPAEESFSKNFQKHFLGKLLHH